MSLKRTLRRMDTGTKGALAGCLVAVCGYLYTCELPSCRMPGLQADEYGVNIPEHGRNTFDVGGGDWIVWCNGARDRRAYLDFFRINSVPGSDATDAFANARSFLEKTGWQFRWLVMEKAVKAAVQAAPPRTSAPPADTPSTPPPDVQPGR